MASGSDTARLRVVLRIRAALRYLAEELALDIPASVLDGLSTLRPCAMERVEYRVYVDRNRVVRPVLRLSLIGFWRPHVGMGLARGLLALPSYLWYRWKLEGRRIPSPPGTRDMS